MNKSNFINIIASIGLSVIASLLGFYRHYFNELNAASYLESTSNVIEVGLIWGAFIGLLYIPLFVFVGKCKKHKMLFVFVSVWVILFGVFATPMFFYISQIV